MRNNKKWMAGKPWVCRCGHHEQRHDSVTGRCQDTALIYACKCSGYVSEQELYRRKRDENFWNKVGDHE